MTNVKKIVGIIYTIFVLRGAPNRPSLYLVTVAHNTFWSHTAPIRDTETTEILRAPTLQLVGLCL
jgi:hypothetical protein